MPRKTALVIGNSAYQDPTLAQLKAPDADVRGLTDLLRHVEVGQFDEVVPLINATEAKTRLAIATFFARARPDDMLLLYFSGHGVLDDKGRLYLAATDTQRDLPQATAISAAFVTDAMDSSPSRRQVLILDCCHSGAFARGARGVAEAKAITAATFEGAGYGRAVLTATDATQYAWEGEAVMGSAENSVFTHCMIEGLRTGAADTDQDGEITLEELYTYIYGEVVKRTPKQTPRKWSYNQEGEFVIARNPHPLPPPPAPLPDDLQHSVDDLRPWVREGALLELERLLFGSTPGLAAAAHTALLKLKDDDSRRISLTATALLTRSDAARQADEAAREAAKAQAAHVQAERERKEQEARALAELAAKERAAREQAEREKQAQAALAEQQRLEREKQEKAEREKQAQAELAEQQRLEREQQEKVEREKQAQAALAEQQRLEREQQEMAEREKQAQAALAEQQRLEREQQMIADREKKIQARLAERQRVEREKAAQAERERLAKVEREQRAQAALAARAQPAPAAPPSAPPKTPAPSAANSTSPLPVVRQPTQPPPAATANATGGLAQLLAAPWLPVVLIGLGWAVSRGVAQAIFNGDSSPYLLKWLLNWLLGGAAGGYLMGLVMRRLEPHWESRHTGQLAAGLAAVWLLNYFWNQAINQYISDLDLGTLYQAAGVLLGVAAGAMAGYWLGVVWRRTRPGVAAQTVAPLTWGWGLAWGLATVVLYVVEASNDWVVAWSFGGLAGGLAGGAVTLAVAGRVRAAPTLPAPARETRRPTVSRQQWVGPIALMALGWGLGWLVAGAYEWLKAAFISDNLPELYYLLDVVGATILGAIGSAFTLWALGRLAPGLTWRLVALWSAAAGLSVMVALATHATLSEMNWSVPDLLLGAFGPVLTGGLGGYALARQWQQLYADLPDSGVWRVAGAWAAAFGFSLLLLKGFLDPTFGVGPIGWGPAGALAGLIGGVATVWVFTRPAAPPAS